MLVQLPGTFCGQLLQAKDSPVWVTGVGCAKHGQYPAECIAPNPEEEIYLG